MASACQLAVPGLNLAENCLRFYPQSTLAEGGKLHSSPCNTKNIFYDCGAVPSTYANLILEPFSGFD